ncbi:ATP-grasp domain-containing protein [Salinivibrio sp. YCSC6]|uniref:ATP-grasp domain-containing protein n=1 Tax=Salinivibrio sp. YCSC6 TaxID=2003370 RepID=UPI000BBCDAAA|nr:ATP-grasp domain-containing protein [Salinivibrio sp. YCSC6]PCE67637.1 hypothetical protein B6G00_04635 [Salinivibrio sp. YCSC6]QCF35463.1 ATP-grasp domain-containing protein [Salinivibrio sp. YCSC6]
MSTANTYVKNILVSGAGGDIGISLGRILLQEKFQGVFGCDISNDNPGECVFDQFFIVPRADNANYFSSLEKIFRQHSIELFIPSSEAEITAILKLDLKEKKLFGVPIVMLDYNSAAIALDKFNTARHLKKHGLKAPWTELAENNEPQAYPCMFKPRSGQGSKGIQVVHSAEQREKISDCTGYIWQELLLPSDQEYTCGIFRRDKECRTIILKRTLIGGFTGKGEVIENSNITDYLIEIAESLNLQGAANFQLRLTESGPRLFEINPRFSSTVMFRHLLGFCDLIWAIENILGLPMSTYIAPPVGKKFYRGYCEFIK